MKYSKRANILNGKILVTGASGFIGRSVCERLSAEGNIKAQYRNINISRALPGVEMVRGELSADFDWRDSLKGVGVIVHCAARAHVLAQISSDPLSQFREVNTYGTLNLARQAALSGVKHFIFLSSLAVNGASSGDGIFSAESPPNPSTPYAISKYEAELGLWKISRETGMSLTILRPPLVYGPGAPGKFGLLVRCINGRLPLPFATLRDKRSFVFLENLVDLIIHCINHPKAFNQLFLVSDDRDVSVNQLIRKIGDDLSRPAILFPVPAFFLNMVAHIFGRSKDIQQLLGPLLVNMEKTKSILNWKPPFNIDRDKSMTVNKSNL